MKRKIRFIVLVFIILIIPIGLIVKRAVAIDIQRDAIKLYQIGDSQKAIEKINLAIKLAPRNYLFYATKAQILESQHNYRDAINEIQKIYSFKDDYAEGYVTIGLNYERLEFPDSANLFYIDALNTYNARIEKYSSDRDRLYSEKVNRAFVYALLKDSVKSKSEFKLLKAEYPEYQGMIEEIESFDKEKDFLKIN
jgi:tetratricopeptide (TPR) repeat protein